MKKNVAAYLDYNFAKIQLLRESERGEVWLVKKKSAESFFVMKLINFTGLPYAKLQKISCDLPAKIFYCAEDSADTVVVEEFLSGENFVDKKISEIAARKYILQLCDGLKILHGLKIIHRDIKPANLILQGEKIKLIDFDAARIFKTSQNRDTKLLGTEGYAPPEQFGFGQTDARSDIFSLGKTFQELVGGNCSRSFKKILAKCTELDPANRYQSVEELKSALLEKKSPARKKILAASLIFAGILFFHSNLQEETFPAPEKVVEQKTAPKKIQPKTPDKTFEFPEIKFPAPEVPDKKISPAQEKISAPEVVTVKKIALAKYFLNGEAVSDWQEYKVFAAQYKKSDWQKFFAGNVEVRVKNFSENPRLKVICESDRNFRAEKIFSGILRGDEIIFSIALSEFNLPIAEPVTNANLQITLLDSSGNPTETRAFFKFVFLALP